jgi:hypothetical protein
MYELKDYLNAINFTKKNVMDSEDNLVACLTELMSQVKFK